MIAGHYVIPEVKRLKPVLLPALRQGRLRVRDVLAREPTSFWRGKVVSFVTLLQGCENVMVMEASYQMLDVLSFCGWETYRDRDNIAISSVKTKVQ